MNNLYRPLIETRPHWSVVGPDHQRLYFNHLDLVGYAPAEAGLLKVYAMNGCALFPPARFKTIPSAKRAALEWLKALVPQLEANAIEWSAHETGVHFIGKVLGFEISTYFFNEVATPKWHAHKRAWFAGTYYLLELNTHEEIRAAVTQTWSEWLDLARKHLTGRIVTVPSKWNPSRSKS